MQNFINDNYEPHISYYEQLQNPSTNEPFNKVTHPSNKPIVSKHIFAVDSRQRNFNLYPNANNYYINIPDRYRNVTSIELKAAMLPRSEYNVNNSNKYLDFSIGDYISNIEIIGNIVIKKNDKPMGKGIYNLTIDGPILKGNHIDNIQAIIEVELNENSNIKNINYLNQGSGYSFSKPPKISLGDFHDFIVTVGKQYNSELREGQYVIGGNPQFTYKDGNTTSSSWVPNNLLCEIESALSYSILNDASYCYSRKSWTSGSNLNDYPLLFSSRLMSQYPSLETYYNNDRTKPGNFETNSCNFNRIYITNCLIFKTKNIHDVNDTFIVNGHNYSILKLDVINQGAYKEYILYCKLNETLSSNWEGLLDNNNYKIAHWEILFASGHNKIINSSSLLGFNKKNYYYNSTLNNTIVNNPINIYNSNTQSTLVPYGITYSTENDYYLYGDPDYTILSFRPRFGGNSITGINDRVDSQPNTNIDKVFACLIFDASQPAVLQDVSSGSSMATINSISNSNNKLLSTFINYDNNFNEVKQLTGNSGNQNVNYNKAPGQLKALKGQDFDKKIIDFPQPIAQIFDINIRFSKYSKLGKGYDEELYNFHGKEHLLLFEITCNDLMTGKRF